jgi:general secretion pathway protein J
MHLRGFRQRGFSLAEALIAVAILAMIGALTFGTLARALDSRDRAAEISDRYHGVRQAMQRMSREISMAFLSFHRDCIEPRTLTMFMGKRAANGMRLDFTSFSHVKMRVDANESDQNELSYFVAQDPNHPDRKNLIRREQNRIDEKPDEGGVEQILADNVESLSFEFYDSKSDRWEDDWDSMSRDFKYRLPKYASITLIVRDHTHKELKFVTKTRLFLKDALIIPGNGFARCPE